MSCVHPGRFNTPEVGAVYVAREPDTALEKLVRPEAVSPNQEAIYGADDFHSANAAIPDANTLDVPNPQSYTLWNRDASNTAWFLCTYHPEAILAQGC